MLIFIWIGTHRMYTNMICRSLFELIPFVFIIVSTIICVQCGRASAELEILPNLHRRSINTTVGEEIVVKDRDLEKTWYSVSYFGGVYRLSSLSDGKPTVGQCGTLYPIYLNAQFPKLQEGKEVELQLCLISYFSDCEKTYNIKVLRSMGSTQYYLGPTGGSSAYCFEQITATEEPAPDYVIPETPVVEAGLRYISQNELRIPELTFTCSFDSSPTRNYYYSVFWYANNKFVKEHAPRLAEDLSQSILTDTDLLNEGVDLGFNLKCGVAVSAAPMGLRTEGQFSSSFFAGVEVSNQTITVRRGKSAPLYVRQTIPIGCIYDTILPNSVQDCDIVLSTVDITRDIFETCEKNDPLMGTVSSVHCGVQLYGTKYSECDAESGMCPSIIYERQLITIRAVNDFHHYEPELSYDLLLKTKGFNNGNTIWRNYTIQTVHVTMINDSRWARKVCWAHSDPQMETFEGSQFENQIIDAEFILYKHKLQQIEVQYRTKHCERAISRSCICSVIARAGGDIWTFDICGNGKIIGFLNCKEGILDVKKHGESDRKILDGTVYKVIFPTGTYMKVYLFVFTEHLNLDIYGSPDDIDNTEGHCGIMNGDPENHFQSREGHIVDAHGFLEDWRVSSENSFFNTKNWNPELWNKKLYICVCPNSSGPLSNEVICSPEQTASCQRLKRDEGQSSHCISRRKRSFKYQRKELERRFAGLTTDVPSGHRQKKSTDAENGKTFKEGYEDCLQFFQAQPLYNLRFRLLDSKLNESLVACARDSSYTKEVSPWSRSHFESWASSIGDEIQRNKTFRTTMTEAVTEYKTTYCPENCNSNGYCLNGVCTCNDGFAGSTCFVKISDPLTITDIEGGGFCDVLEGDHCHECHRVQAEYLTNDFMCHISVYENYFDGNSSLVDSIQQAGEFENLFEGYCCPRKDTPREKRSSISTAFVTKYEISVSNDGEHFGPSKSVVVFDSTCQTYDQMPDGELLFSLLTGFCFIDGRCYENGEHSITSDCDVCNADHLPFYWSNGCLEDRDSSNTDQKTNGEGSSSKTVIIVSCSVAVTVVIVIAIVAIALLKRFKTKRAVSASNPKLSTSQGSAKHDHHVNATYWHTYNADTKFDARSETVLSPTYLSLDLKAMKEPVYEYESLDSIKKI